MSRRGSYFSFYQRVYDYFELEESNCDFGKIRYQLQAIKFSNKGFYKGKDSFSLLTADYSGSYCARDIILSEDFFVSDPGKLIFDFSSLKYKLRFLLSIKLRIFICLLNNFAVIRSMVLVSFVFTSLKDLFKGSGPFFGPVESVNFICGIFSLFLRYLSQVGF